MLIGQQLKQARLDANYTQEKIAEQIGVSRQTISNWENGRSYPDILNVIELSEVYHISLDQLLKGDAAMVQHLVDSTNTVKMNQRILKLLIANIILMGVAFIGSYFVPNNNYYIFGVFILMIVTTSYLLYQIIKGI